MEWPIGGGAPLTIGAGVAGYIQSGAQRIDGRRIEAGKQAYQAIVPSARAFAVTIR